MIIGNKNFDIGYRTYIVGILNITPDSFSDGGKFIDIKNAIEQAKKLVKDGADIIELGGESTRPGSTPVKEEEELNRVIPILKEIVKIIDVPISIDTKKSRVAEESIKHGASIINDVSCLRSDSKIAKICAMYDTPLCIMHNRDSMDDKDYDGLLSNVLEELKTAVSIAIKAGVKKDNIIIDPGLGFAKTREMSLQIIDNLEVFSSLKYPVMLGASRKSFIGDTLNLPLNERIEGTIATTVIAISKFCDFIRVHDVKENKRACKMADAIIRKRY